MRIKKTAVAIAGSTVIWLVVAASALAATSPTVALGTPTKVGAGSAVLNASVNPQQAKTTYHFSYGPTAALGLSGPEKTVAAGKKSVAVSYTVSGLQSGTTYYYAVQATNPSGTVTTQVKAFKTTGPPPPSVTTGPAIVLSSSSVTLTGSVAPNDAATTYEFEYGTTPAYGTLSAPVTLAPSSTQQSISVTLPALASGTLFYFNLVATHGGVNSATGVGGQFETFPNPVPKPPVGQTTTPREKRGGPFVFDTVGHVRNDTNTPDAYACNGTVTIAFDHGDKRVYAQTVPLSSTCTFGASSSFAHLPVKLGHGVHSEHLTVYARFNGNGFLARHEAAPETVVLS